MNFILVISIFATMCKFIYCDITLGLKEGCQIVKGCLSKPADCTPFIDCAYFLSYSVTPSNHETITIELFTTLFEARTAIPQWVAIGFSNDEVMGEDAVTYCAYNEALSGFGVQLQVGLAYNRGKSNIMFPRKASTVKALDIKIINSSFLCRFEQKIIPDEDNALIWPLDKNYHLLLSSGVINTGKSFAFELGAHIMERTNLKFPYVSHRVNMTNVQLYSSTLDEAGWCIGELVGDYLIKFHGMLMIIGWWVFIAIAILFSRYFRTLWPEKKIMGSLIWFKCHQGLNMVGVLLIAAAFICIFVSQCGRWIGADWPNHAITGMTASICAFIQPIISYFRCHPGTSKRSIFNWIHRLIGLAGFCCASAAIYFATTSFNYIGLDYQSRGAGPVGMITFYWVSLFVVAVALEILITLSERIKRKRITNEMQMQGLLNIQLTEEKTGLIGKPTWNILRLVLLGIFVAVAITVTSTLSFFIWLSA